MEDQKAEVIAFYNAHAGAYDEAVEGSVIGRRIRERVHARLALVLRPGDHVLDVNCGTGTDALRLAEHGMHVTGTDLSPGVIAVAREKAVAAGLSDRIAFSVSDADALSSFRNEKFDAIISILNGINHLGSPGAFAAASAERLRSGGRLFFTVLNTHCGWEIAYFLLKGKPEKARARWGDRSEELRTGEQPFALRLYSPLELAAYFREWFSVTGIEGFGIALPPAGIFRNISRHPRTYRLLASIENAVSGSLPWVNFSDQFLLEMSRR